jgi:hypothetical protein
MGIFDRAPKIGRPVAQAAQTTGLIPFPGCPNIQIKAAVIPQTNTNYATTVLQHLNEIQSFPVGQLLFNGIRGFGKTIVIQNAGAMGNQAASGPAGYKKLRYFHDKVDNANFAAELQATLLKSGHDKRWLADQLHKIQLPQWNGGTSPSPFRNLRQPIAPPAPGGRRPLPLTPIQLNEMEIDRWLAAQKLPTRDELDIVMLALETWLNNSTGSGTKIDYDAHKVIVGGKSRPPHVALFHELVHAYYSAMGGQLGREDSVDVANGGRLFELMAVGLGPFTNSPISENKFRNAIGIALRTQY